MMVSQKTVPLSVRVPHEDAEFLAGLQVNGAKTPSDKLRSIISEARRQHEGSHDYDSSLTLFEDQMASTLHAIRKSERAASKHSELIALVNAKLPELMAFIVSYASDRESLDLASMQEFERGVADRVIRFLESIMRLAVTPSCPCYDKHAIVDRIGPTIDIARIILAAMETREEST